MATPPLASVTSWLAGDIAIAGVLSEPRLPAPRAEGRGDGSLGQLERCLNEIATTRRGGQYGDLTAGELQLDLIDERAPASAPTPSTVDWSCRATARP